MSKKGRRSFADAIAEKIDSPVETVHDVVAGARIFHKVLGELEEEISELRDEDVAEAIRILNEVSDKLGGVRQKVVMAHNKTDPQGEDQQLAEAAIDRFRDVQTLIHNHRYIIQQDPAGLAQYINLLEPALFVDGIRGVDEDRLKVLHRVIGDLLSSRDCP